MWTGQQVCFCLSEAQLSAVLKAVSCIISTLPGQPLPRTVAVSDRPSELQKVGEPLVLEP